MPVRVVDGLVAFTKFISTEGRRTLLLISFVADRCKLLLISFVKDRCKLRLVKSAGLNALSDLSVARPLEDLAPPALRTEDLPFCGSDCPKPIDKSGTLTSPVFFFLVLSLARPVAPASPPSTNSFKLCPSSPSALAPSNVLRPLCLRGLIKGLLFIPSRPPASSA